MKAAYQWKRCVMANNGVIIKYNENQQRAIGNSNLEKNDNNV